MESIVLQPHNPEWIRKFAREKALLLSSLHDCRILVRHVGSTAVPGLLAKPIIDIAIEAAIFPPAGNIVSILAGIGYEYRGEAGIPGRIWFTKGHPREFNLHFCPSDSEIVRGQIQFRDCLRRDEQLRLTYAALKLNISKGKDIDDPEYARAKTELIYNATGRPCSLKPDAHKP